MNRNQVLRRFAADLWGSRLHRADGGDSDLKTWAQNVLVIEFLILFQPIVEQYLQFALLCNRNILCVIGWVNVILGSCQVHHDGDGSTSSMDHATDYVISM